MIYIEFKCKINDKNNIKTLFFNIRLKISSFKINANTIIKKIIS